MKHFFLYGHGGSGNHGCEAIVRSTIQLIPKSDIILISSRPDEDIKYGVGELCRVVPDINRNFSKATPAFWKAYFDLKVKQNYLPMDKLQYRTAFSYVNKGDIALSIGGDNYCYADVQKYVMFHDMLKARRAKTVLWGCSLEKEVASLPEIKADLERYDLITARESLTYEVLKRINPNTILVSDSAFHLEMREMKLPDQFEAGNTVGINLSPMVLENEKIPGIVWQNYVDIIQYILNQTDMRIALIPHVVWGNNDDRIPLNRLYTKFKDTNRICLIGDCNCEYLKYVISKCRFFIGARTHATIAAYSTGVPTLVMGYSVKSKGIAKDLLGEQQNGYVVSVQQLTKNSILKDTFVELMNKEKWYVDHLRKVLPEYKNRTMNAVSRLNDLIER